MRSGFGGGEKRSSFPVLVPSKPGEKGSEDVDLDMNQEPFIHEKLWSMFDESHKRNLTKFKNILFQNLNTM